MIAKAGGRPIILDLNEAGAGLAQELGGQFFKADVTSAAEVQMAIDGAGAIHGAVSCAGVAIAARVIGKEGPADLAAFEHVVRINLIGTYNVVRLAAWAMSKNEPNSDGERGVIKFKFYPKRAEFVETGKEEWVESEAE